MQHPNSIARRIRPSPSLLAVSLLAAALSQALCVSRLSADDDLAQLEQQAIREAVARVAPSVVKIETIGGLEKVEGALIGEGPTTGVVVSPDGYILSSAFNFVQQPSSIIVTLPSGERAAARRVATDHSRMLVLLKVQTEQSLSAPQASPPAEIEVGAWAIAVGRTLADDEVNVSVGIVSAVGRMLGRAIQTDAKISAHNYGGPLIDIRGRVLGVLSPLSPEDASQVAGVQWYDSGIGFAVPLATVFERLDALKAGRDLFAGKLGISFKEGDPYADPPVIAVVQPGSPAREAGLKAGDRIVAVDDRPVKTQMHLKLALGPKYAGDTVEIAVRRGGEELQFAVELIDRIPPFEHAFLGVLPLRAIGDDEPDGIVVRYVYPGSPAAKAGVQRGDRITRIAESSVKNDRDGRAALGAATAGEAVAVEFARGADKQEAQLTTAALPTEIPAALPPAHRQPPARQGPPPATGRQSFRLPQFANECLLYVPENYHPQVGYGLVVWLHASGGDEEKELIQRWSQICRDRDLILLAPQAADPDKWAPDEAGFIRQAVDHVTARYPIDPARIVAHGYQAGGAMAYLAAFAHRDLFRAVAAVDAPLPGLIDAPANDPVQRLAIYTTTNENARFAARIESSIATLRTAKYPVTALEQTGKPSYLTAEELLDLARWIDALDRL